MTGGASGEAPPSEAVQAAMDKVKKVKDEVRVAQ
jgi:hypothetical protein